MSSIETSILRSTVGLLLNKARDSTAAKLKDGDIDITDAKIWEIVVKDLNDIRTKLDGILQKDLLCSFIFLQEGVDFLNVIPIKSKLEQNEKTQEDQCESSTVARNEEFDSASKRFKEARGMAKIAFHNDALSVRDRIFAAKLWIVSQILECLNVPQIGITGCLSCLKSLHSLPVIREIFIVHLKGGLKSLVYRSERDENIKSVMLINYVLFQYVSKFRTCKYLTALAWPTIDLVDRSFNPVLNWLEISKGKSMKNLELPTPPLNELRPF